MSATLKTVDLELCHVIDRFALGELRYPAVPVSEFLFGIRIFEAEHRPREAVSGKLLCRLAADSLRRRIGSDKLRVFGFESLELTHELIEFVIGNGRLVENVVTVFVFSNLFAELARYVR